VLCSAGRGVSYRSDRNRNTEGFGLGLSLLTAIVKLHDFHFAIAAGPDCATDIVSMRLSQLREARASNLRRQSLLHESLFDQYRIDNPRRLPINPAETERPIRLI
jgi:hypothetical protein